MYESQNMRKKWLSVFGDSEEQTEEEQDSMKVQKFCSLPYTGKVIITTININNCLFIKAG